MKIQTMRARLLASSILCATAFTAAGAAHAQTAPAGEVEEVVVTGSRIARQDYVASSPIVTVGTEAIERTGSVTVEALLQQSPQFVPAISQTSNNPSNGGQANLDLRGLGSQRTLILVDGRRVVPSGSDGTVDVNNIPDALIENIEVITGGASATYGSDALAGVINFKLKRNFQGVEINGQYGITSRRDGQTDSMSITMGGNFADDRGNAVISLNYSNRDLVYNAARPLTQYSGPSSTNPLGSYTAVGTNLPTQAAMNAYFLSQGVAAGTVLNNAVRLSFNPDGSLTGPTGVNWKGPTTIDYQTIYSAVGGTGVPQGNYNTGPLNYNTLPLTRYQGFGRVTYDVTDLITAWAETRFTQYSATQELAASPASGSPSTGVFPGSGGTGFWVPVTNPFIPDGLRGILASRPNRDAPFLLAKRFSDLGARHAVNDYTTYQILAGLSGQVPALDWTWDLFASQGRNQRTEVQTGNVLHGAVRQLLEASDGGRSLCTGGYNPFGPNPLSASCAAFIGRTTKNLTTLEQRNAEFNLSGGLFDLPAGEVKFAAGVSYLSNDYQRLPDSVLTGFDISPGLPFNSTVPTDANPTPAQVLAGIQPFQNYRSNAPSVIGFNSSSNVNAFIDTKEIFGELLIPVIKDFPLIAEFNIGAAARLSSYSSIGSVSTYKIDMDWKVIESVRVRGGYSRAIRAPGLVELFASPTNSFPTVGNAGPTANGAGDPCDVNGAYRRGTNGAAVRTLCLAQGVPSATIDTYTYGNAQVQGVTGGNPNLDEETANTYSIGVVVRPQFDMPLFSNMSASVDYYQIKIGQLISFIETSVAIQYCYNFTSAGIQTNPTYSTANPFCQLFTRDPATGNIINGNLGSQNLGYEKTAGTDFQFDWKFGLGDIGLSDSWGDLSINLTGTKLKKFDVLNVPGIPVLDRKVGTIGSASATAYPEWKFNTSVVYSIADIDLGLRWRFIDNMTSFATGAPATPEFSYYDLDARWKMNDTVELRAGVNNVEDKLPPFFSPSQQGNTDPTTYDTLGRRYYAGFKLRF